MTRDHDTNTEQTKPHDVESIYVGISRLTQLQDVRIWPIDLKNPREIEHLLRLRRDVGTKLWKRGYDAEGYWDPRLLRCCMRIVQVQARRTGACMQAQKAPRGTMNHDAVCRCFDALTLHCT